jgi:hypothetical protein
MRSDMWFQHDGAPPYFSLVVRAHLNNTYGVQWIGRARPVAWTARPPNLMPLDFFLWGHVKSIMYALPADTREELIV